MKVKHGWALHNTKNRGLESYSYRIHFTDGLVASALWGKGIATGEGAPASILLPDEGKAKAGPQASDRINWGEQVLTVDLILTGEAQPQRRNTSDSHRYAQLLATVGDRPLGIRASHLLALAKWLKDHHGAPEVRVEAQGFRSQVVALLGAALDPTAFSEVRVDKGIKSLDHLLAKPVPTRRLPNCSAWASFLNSIWSAWSNWLNRSMWSSASSHRIPEIEVRALRCSILRKSGRPGSGDSLVPVFIADAERAAGELMLPDTPAF